VVLRAALPNQAYTLAFIPLSNPGARQTLGSFTTNASGNGRLETTLNQSSGAPDDLGTRVGVFVLRRNDTGADAFVTAA
jgi:hypothetical protein